MVFEHYPMIRKVKGSYLIAVIITALLLGEKSLHAAVDSDQLQNAITLSQRALISQQNKDGYWISYVETNTFYNALQILLYYFLGREGQERETIEGLCRYLVNTQSEDGSWPLYDGGPSDLSLSTLNYFALKLSGYREEEVVLVRARDYIRSHGGAESIYGMYQIILALFDQFQLSFIPQVPIFPLLLVAPSLSWFRMMFIPLMVVLREGAIYCPPETSYIDELFINQAEGRVIRWNEEPLKTIDAWGKKICRVFPEDLSIPFLSGSFSTMVYLNWLLARQNTTDGLFYDCVPSTFFPLLSLKALEDIANNEEAIDKALNALNSFQQQLPEGVYQPPTDATIPATFSAIMALLETGLTMEDVVVKKGVDFLWNRQSTRYGDWVYQMIIPVGPGGWGFNLNSESFPDIDDTTSTLFVLKTAYGDRWEERMSDFTRGIQWLLAMQNWDGGWGTWDRKVGCLTTLLKEAMSSVVFDESVVDHTTRVLTTLSLFGCTEATSFQVAWAVRWIKAQRLEDGSWPATWFINYLYETANVLGAFSVVDAEMSDDFIQKSLDYLLEKQREDGGWGESPSSFSVGSYVTLGYSSPSQTALILFGLLQFLRGRDYQYLDQLRSPINKALSFILSTQKENGLWEDSTYVGVVFPRVQYMRYPIFQEASILEVLGMYYQDIDHF